LTVWKHKAGFQDKWHYYLFVVYLTMFSVAHVAHSTVWCCPHRHVKWENIF